MRILAELHKDAPYHDGSFEHWAKEPSIQYPFRWDDGTRFYMARVDEAPWDEWTTDANASPIQPDGWSAQPVNEAEV